MRILITILFLGSGTLSFAQFSKELDKRNGFKDIKLLSDVSAYSGIEYWKDDKAKEGHAIYKAVKGSYENIGELEIDRLTVYTYNKIIYQIEVQTDKNEKLYRSLEKAYGKIHSSIAFRIPYWEGEKLKLYYEVEGAKKLKLRYLSKQINQIIAMDKKKAVDSLSTEF